MIFNRYQGDPAIAITPDGACMTFRGGQPVMDKGFHNAILISLHTKPGWWGNVFETEESKKIGSNFERNRVIQDIKTINEIIDDANQALKWMLDKNIAEKINVDAVNIKLNNIDIKITIKPLGSNEQEFLLTENGLSWINQALNPANERL
jgi:phage gp46-like protein